MVAEGKQTFRTKYFGDKAFYKMIMAIALPIVIQNLLTNFDCYA